MAGKAGSGVASVMQFERIKVVHGGAGGSPSGFVCNDDLITVLGEVTEVCRERAGNCP